MGGGGGCYLQLCVDQARPSMVGNRIRIGDEEMKVRMLQFRKASMMGTTWMGLCKACTTYKGIKRTLGNIRTYKDI